MSTKIIDDRDPSVVYTSGWGQAGSSDEYNSTTSDTANPGSSATLRFSGTGVSVFGTITSIDGLGHGGPPQSAYSVDGGAETHYTGVQRSNTQYKVQFFQSGALSPGEHTLVVSYTATNFSILYLDFFEITGSDLSNVPPSSTPLPFSATSSSPPSSPSSSSIPFGQSGSLSSITATASQGSSMSDPLLATVTITSNDGSAASDAPSSISSTNNSRSGPIGAIIGGVLGGLLLLALLALLLLCRRRKRPQFLLESQTNSNAASSSQITPFNHSVSRGSAASSPTHTNSLLRTPFTKFPPLPTGHLHRHGTPQSSIGPSEDSSSIYPTGLSTTQPNTRTSLASEGTLSQNLPSYLSEKGALMNQVQVGVNTPASFSNQLHDSPPSYNDAR